MGTTPDLSSTSPVVFACRSSDLHLFCEEIANVWVHVNIVRNAVYPVKQRGLLLPLTANQQAPLVVVVAAVD